MNSDSSKDCRTKPCPKDCPKRSATCHFDGTCKDYIIFAASKQKEREARKLESEMDDYVRCSIAKRLKKEKYKRKVSAKYD